MNSGDLQHVFGPVRSGRLGVSLGVDLLGEKICSFDCLYCEVGPTRVKTRERSEYVRPEQIFRELEIWKGKGLDSPDYLTLAGLGEPTLNSAFAEIAHGCKRIFPKVPLAVITNSSLLDVPEARDALNICDVALPSLDSLVESEFRKINRPDMDLRIGDIARNLLEWRRGFMGLVRLEVLLIEGINDSEENLNLLKDYLREMKPEFVDVVTLSRPPAYPGIRGVSRDTLNLWRRELGAEIGDAVRKYSTIGTEWQEDELRKAVINSLRRRPQKASEIASLLGVTPERALNVLNGLVKDELALEIENGTDEGFFVTVAGKKK